MWKSIICAMICETFGLKRATNPYLLLYWRWRCKGRARVKRRPQCLASECRWAVVVLERVEGASFVLFCVFVCFLFVLVVFLVPY